MNVPEQTEKKRNTMMSNRLKELGKKNMNLHRHEELIKVHPSPITFSTRSLIRQDDILAGLSINQYVSLM